MNVLTAQDIRKWDQYTIGHEPIASIDLMERAAHACTAWLTARFPQPASFAVFCGRGNNGGDGLAMARQLQLEGYHVKVYVLQNERAGSPDFETNYTRWQDKEHLFLISSENDFPPFEKDEIIIDALIGSGLSAPLSGLAAALATHINGSKNKVISIDLPSGLFTDGSSKGHTTVHAHTTLTFQVYKLGLLLAENGAAVGEVVVLDIGLHPGFLQENSFDRQMITPQLIDGIYQPRKPYAHKGSFGHALLLAGSYGKMGAALLSARACIYTGSGLLTTAVPRCGYVIMQTALPEAMTLPDPEEEHLSRLPEGLEKYNAIGIGPGVGTGDTIKSLLASLLEKYRQPLVIDADALNCLAQDPSLLDRLPPQSILTPHPKEFDRLFGGQANEADRIHTAMEQARARNIIIVLKGFHTLVATPQNGSYFNTTGNAGMAKGGSGDVLTGIITALVAQHYTPHDAAVFGVYLHGMAGDLAARERSQEAMTASDLTDFLGPAFLKLAGRTGE